MAARKKLEDVDSDEVQVTTAPVAAVPLALDISKLVNDVKGRYGRDKTGLSNDIVTGTEISLPTDDSSYVLSDGMEFWKLLIGVKGIPYGRIVQVAGKPDSGKSTTAMMFMAAAQKAGALVILWDSEKKFDTVRFKEQMGGSPESIAVSRSKMITEGAKQVAWYVRAAKEQNPNIKIFIVWDSVGATLNSTQDDDDSDEYSKQPGVDAKEINWAMKKFNKLIERYRNLETGEETIAVCCVNQVYANIGSVGHKEKGGSGIEYLSSVILQLSRKSDLNRVRDGKKMKYGIITRAKVRKNHLFSGEDCIAELELVVSSDGITLAEKIKTKSGLVGWDESD